MKSNVAKGSFAKPFIYVGRIRVECISSLANGGVIGGFRSIGDMSQ